MHGNSEKMINQRTPYKIKDGRSRDIVIMNQIEGNPKEKLIDMGCGQNG